MSRFPKANFLLSVAAPIQFPVDTGAEVAFAGRSNAGKSSAINAISGRKALARTSKTPGQTRLLNYFSSSPTIASSICRGMATRTFVRTNAASGYRCSRPCAIGRACKACC